MSTVRLRLTVCLSTVAATAAVGALLAPAASADPVRPTLPEHVRTTNSVAPGVQAGLPPFGRKL